MDSLYREFAIILCASSAVSVIVYLFLKRAFAARPLFPRLAVSSRVLDRFFLIVVVLFFALYAVLDIQQYTSFSFFGYDFAVFDQSAWNSMQGRLFENTIIADAPMLLGQHFSPILLALVPLYVLSRPWLFVVLSALTVAVTAFPLYWIARPRVGRGLALCIVIAFLFSPVVQYRALDQYYEAVWLPPLIMLAMFFMLRQRYVPFLICLGLVLLCREEMAFVAIGFGLFIAFAQRKWKLGLGIALASFLWGFLLLEMIMPFLNGRTAYYYFSGNAEWGSQHYGYLGANLSEILFTLVTRPDIVVPRLLTPAKISAVVQMLFPLGVFSLLGAHVSALALPTLGYTLLSDVEGNYILRSHLYAPALPFLFLGAVVGIQRLLEWRTPHWNTNLEQAGHSRFAQVAMGVFILTASFATYLINAPGPWARFFEPGRYAVTEHARLGETIVKMIPDNAAVVTQEELVSHLSERQFIYLMPAISCLADADYLFADTTRPWYNYQRYGWQVAFTRPFFTTVLEQDGYILKKYTANEQMENSVNARFGEGIVFLGYTLPLTSTVLGGENLFPSFAWRVNGQAPEKYILQFRLVDPEDHVWAQFDREPCRRASFQDLHGGDELYNDDAKLHLLPTMPPGNYRLVVAILDAKTNQFLEVRDASGRELGKELGITTVRVEKNKSSIEANDLVIEQRQYVDMREMRFLGYVPPPHEISRGKVLEVGLYWRARGKPKGNYTVTVQLCDPTGRVVLDQSAPPANGAYPTTLWNAGEVLLDWHDLDLPTDMPTGEYQLLVSLSEDRGLNILGKVQISTIKITQ